MDLVKVLNRRELSLTRKAAEISSELKRISAAIEALSERPRHHRVVSIASRRKMSASQKRRWAARRAAA